MLVTNKNINWNIIHRVHDAIFNIEINTGSRSTSGSTDCDTTREMILILDVSAIVSNSDNMYNGGSSIIHEKDNNQVIPTVARKTTRHRGKHF